MERFSYHNRSYVIFTALFVPETIEVTAEKEELNTALDPPDTMEVASNAITIFSQYLGVFYILNNSLHCYK